MFHLSNEELVQKKAFFTASEILQQPKLWDDVFRNIQEDSSIHDFLDKILQTEKTIRVIFTGAGTSAYVGDTLLPIIRSLPKNPEFFFESIPTTDIVSDPLAYLQSDQPTLIVSFARSGNSPESVATIDVAKQVIDSCYFLTITCNVDGDLAKKSINDPAHLVIHMPEKSNDKGFAMTSSFTCMLYSAYLIFAPQQTADLAFNQSLIQTAGDFITSVDEAIPELDKASFERIIYLGSSSLGNLSREAALKCLELNSGIVDAYFESSMGFRHGPKSLLSNKSLVVLMSSAKEYTRLYDMDIAKEVKQDVPLSKLVVLCAQEETPLYEFADHLAAFDLRDTAHDNTLFRSLIFILFAQMFALHHSLLLDITPDNPSPDGKVNRVVHGVKIHSFQK